MAYGKTLKVLPSVIADSDGAKTEWGQLSAGEQERTGKAFCQKIGRSLSAYYSSHQEDWEKLAAEFLQE